MSLFTRSHTSPRRSLQGGAPLVYTCLQSGYTPPQGVALATSNFNNYYLKGFYITQCPLFFNNSLPQLSICLKIFEKRMLKTMPNYNITPTLGYLTQSSAV